MLILEGLATSPGLVTGPLHMLAHPSRVPEMRTIANISAEIERVKHAMEEAKMQLQQLHQRALQQAGEDVAAIFEIHAMMLEDEDFADNIYGIIENESLCAEYAVYTTGQQFTNLFANMDDDVMRERAADVQDLSARLLDILAGQSSLPLSNITHPVVVAAEELLPSQTILMDKALVLAFVTRRGSFNSHASILARSLGIPSVSGLAEGFGQLSSVQTVIVDGGDGVVIASPTKETLVQYEEKARQLEQEKQELRQLVGLPAKTTDGASIELCANIGHPDETAAALQNDAEGVGLFRSEFLYLESNDFPSEEVQFNAYKAALEAMAPKRVVIRTLDLGADKQAPYFQLEPEENPALGYRAIRICLDRLDIFIPQLRALLRASLYGNLAVMFPMVTGPDEVRSIQTVIQSVKENLTAEGIAFSNSIQFGIMIETPAAVMVADKLAPLVDFFSIGTNDLTQYTCAVDRMNTKVSHLFTPGAVSLLRMVQHVARQAHKHGIWVGICGESAADINLLPYYLGMDIDELSMSPHSILKVKQATRSLHKKECEAKTASFLQ